MAINASIQTAINEGVLHRRQPVPDIGTSGSSHHPSSLTSRTPESPPCPPSVPSAPPISEDTLYPGSIEHPLMDSSSSTDVEREVVKSKNGEESGTNSSPSFCVICLDSPIQGACVPCGHMAGCMLCLKEIKAKKGACPVCRAKIEQIVRLYTV